MAADNGNFPKWDELLPDALGLIFKKLPLSEVLTVVPSVCKTWRRTVMGPYCWQDIDIEEWSRSSKPEVIDRMLRLLITRSCGSLRKLCVTGLTDDQSLSFVANNTQSLQTLRLPRCEIHDSIMIHTAKMFANLTVLDLSYCLNIGVGALEAIGNNCKFLTTLRRVMHPLEVIDKLSQVDEALVIANTMPQLKHLEIAYLLVNTPSVMEIINKCKNLELLDLRGCWEVNLEEGFTKGFPNLKVIGPLVVDCYDQGGWENCSDYSGSSGYLAWDFIAGEVDDEEEDYPEIFDDFWEDDENPIDDVEMWFYDDVNIIDDWPHSP